jgi:hypothetical protein
MARDAGEMMVPTARYDRVFWFSSYRFVLGHFRRNADAAGLKSSIDKSAVMSRKRVFVLIVAMWCAMFAAWLGFAALMLMAPSVQGSF